MDTIFSAFSGIADGIGPFLILLGILIFVHELGHFLVAKFYGVRVEVFSLGFGKKIIEFKKGDTNYCVSLIPLGGYVKMFGDDPTKEISESEKKYSFLHQPVWPRIAIVLAGPLMNLFFAFLIFVFLSILGEPVPGQYLGDIAAGSRAHEAGFRSGDKILSINNSAVRSWLEVKELISNSANEKLHFEVEREDSQERAQIAITPLLGLNDNILSNKNQVGLIEGLDPYSQAAMIGVMSPNSLAGKAGLKTLDVIIEVNGREVLSWRNLEAYIKEDAFKGRTPLKLKVQSGENEKSPVREVALDIPADQLNLGQTHGDSQVSPRIIELHEFGIESAELYLWKVKRGSPADQAGLRAGDRLTGINEDPLTDWKQVIETVKKFDPDGSPIKFKFRRDDEEKTVEIRPEMNTLMDARGQEEKRFTVGVVAGHMQSGPKFVKVQAEGIGEIITTSIKRTNDTIGMVIMSLVRLIQGDVSAKNIGGIISIGRFANQSYDAGLAAFLRMMALISINLFLLNLLPVPVLDGGHLVFFSIEALRGAPVSMRKMEVAQQVGLVILMSLMAFALFNDIANWLNSVW